MKPEPVTTNGRAIRRFRILAVLTSHGLAAKAGISQGYLSNLERDIRDASPAVLKRIADALDVRIADIVDDHMAAAA